MFNGFRNQLPLSFVVCATLTAVVLASLCGCQAPVKGTVTPTPGKRITTITAPQGSGP